MNSFKIDFVIYGLFRKYAGNSVFVSLRDFTCVMMVSIRRQKLSSEAKRLSINLFPDSQGLEDFI